MKREARRRLVELPVKVDEKLLIRLSEAARKIGIPIEEIAHLSMAYGVNIAQDGQLSQSGGRIIVTRVSRRFHLTLRRLEIRTPASRGLLVGRGMGPIEEHCRRLAEPDV